VSDKPLAIRAGGRMIEISRPGKQLFPSGITKADLAGYYERAATPMLAQIADRPLNLERYPDGIASHRIIQQHASAHFPSWIARVEVGKRKGTVEHVVAIEPATLVYLAGQACITLHAWLSRRDRLFRPDRLIVDLDPTADDPQAIRQAALRLGGLLRELGLRPWAMATGSRGYHLVVPLQRRADFDQVREFARDLAVLAVAREGETFTIEQRKTKREGRILIDILRNGYGHTAVAPYSVRPRPTAPVATPLQWDELSDPATRADRWTIRTVIQRLERDGDPWERIGEDAQTLGPARRRLADALAELPVRA
jgi:bifunctional non-homologous end joining protein LigD